MKKLIFIILIILFLDQIHSINNFYINQNESETAKKIKEVNN